MFPGFSALQRSESEQVTTSKPLEFGTHSIMLGEFRVVYTLRSFDAICGLSIDEIRIPMRSLMMFSVRHVVGTEIVFSESGYKLRYTSPLFDSFTDELPTAFSHGAAITDTTDRNRI
jgi:hypothetical protein